MRLRRPTRDPSVARQVLVLQVLVVLVLVVVALALAAYDARRDARASATERAVAVAEAVADSPTVVGAVGRTDPSRDRAAVRRVRAPRHRRRLRGGDGARPHPLQPPRPGLIGKPFVGDLGTAPAGGIFTQEYTGTLGPSMRSVVPVRDAGRVVALVSVGITVSRIDEQLRRDLGLILLAALAVLAVGLAGAWLVSRRLRRQTHGLGEREITRMYEYYSAVLHAVREGLLLLDDAGRVQLVNDEARRLLRLPDDVVGRSVHDLGLPPGLVAAALGRTRESDDIYVAGDHVLVVSSAPASWQGRDVGAVVTLRDHTELRSVTGELDVVRGLTESLRSQNHEAANRLHTVVALIEMGRAEEAVDFATEELQVAQLLTDQVVGAVGDPVVAALLLGKTAEAAERGIELTIDGRRPDRHRRPVARAGHRARQPRRQRARRRDRRARSAGWRSPSSTPTGLLRVVVGRQRARARPPSRRGGSWSAGWTTKASAHGLGGRGVGLALVGQVARRHGGDVRIGTSPLGGARVRGHVPSRRVAAGGTP